MMELRDRIAGFAAALDDIWLKCPFSVTSWWRTPRRNRAVGGHPQSKHLLGLACDLVVDLPGQNEELRALLVRRFPVVVDEGVHIHVQAVPHGWTQKPSGRSLSRAGASPEWGGAGGGVPQPPEAPDQIQSERT